MNHPIIDITNLYLQKSGYTFKHEEIGLQISTHSGFPNLIVISDLFHHFGIDHLSLKLEKEIDTLHFLPDIFIAHGIKESNPITVLVEKRKKNLRVYFSKNKSDILSYNEFMEFWSGIVISLNESNLNSLRAVSDTNSFKKILFGGLLLSTIVFLAFSGISLTSFFWLLTSSIGLLTGAFIVQQELGLNLKAVQKICNSFENTSCEAVISSKGASVFGMMKLSDIGIVYFSTHILVIMLSLNNSAITLNLLFWSALLSIPFIIYSLAYQGLIIKKWCPLCLGVIGVLGIQVALTFFSGNISLINSGSIISVSSFLFALLIVSAIWFWIRPLLKKETELKKLRFESLRFKRNFTFFKAALIKMPKVSKYHSSANDIVFGNSNSKYKITLLTNPLCYFCMEGHQILENLITSNNDDIEFTIRFNIANPNESNKAAQIAHYFLKVYNEQGPEKCLKVMTAFYETENKRNWIDKVKQKLKPEYFDLLYMHHHWCEENAINFTPGLIIDEQLFPKKYYKIQELSYFIEDLLKNKYDQSLQPSIH